VGFVSRRLEGDGGGEGVGQLVDLFEQVGEDALGFLASPDRGQLRGNGAEVVQDAADLDQAVVQLVDGFGVFERVVVLVVLVGSWSTSTSPAAGGGPL
jgi:hypothetical protein